MICRPFGCIRSQDRFDVFVSNATGLQATVPVMAEHGPNSQIAELADQLGQAANRPPASTQFATLFLGHRGSAAFAGSQEAVGHLARWWGSAGTTDKIRKVCPARVPIGRVGGQAIDGPRLPAIAFHRSVHLVLGRGQTEA